MDGFGDTSVSVIVPTLNEAGRLGPCLAGLAKQGDPLMEVIVVDSGSTDGTAQLVRDAARTDPRFRLERDPELPAGWIGKVWALQHGLSLARGDWVLGVDADTEANAGMVAGAMAAAREHGFDVVSFAPEFAGQTAGERLVQPALLATLVYRTGAPGTRRAAEPRRLLANGQCFLARRETLVRHGGYAPARSSFADDVALVRHLAATGVRCGFLDGRLLYRVRSYRSAQEMWREWGRSVDLRDASPALSQVADLAMLVLVQVLPLPLVLAALLGPWETLQGAVLWLNATLLSVRVAVHLALAPSYERRGLPYAFSLLADGAAVARVILSTIRRPVAWRGRSYRSLQT